MSEPRVAFTLWMKWNERGQIECRGDPGVYLLAHFPRDRVPDGAASPLDTHIVYIGETHKQTLAKRWNDFAQSAPTGQKGHAGGRTYHNRFHRLQRNLYVAAYAPKQPKWTSRCRSFFIRHVESKLIWRFVLTHGDDGLCNKD